jgi:hypothetical protein
LAWNNGTTFLAGLEETSINPLAGLEETSINSLYNFAVSTTLSTTLSTTPTESWRVYIALNSSRNSIGSISSVAYFKGYWIVLASNTAYYIVANGNGNGNYNEWSQCLINDSSSPFVVDSFNQFVVGGEYIMINSTSGIYFSSDGTHWNSTFISKLSTLYSLCYAGSYFIVAGSYSSDSITNYALLFSKLLTFSTYDILSLSFSNPSSLQVAAGVYNSTYYVLINAPPNGLYLYSGSTLSYLSYAGSYSATIQFSSIQWAATGSYFIATSTNSDNVIIWCPSKPGFTSLNAPLVPTAVLFTTYGNYFMGNSFASTELLHACPSPFQQDVQPPPIFATVTNPSIYN